MKFRMLEAALLAALMPVAAHSQSNLAESKDTTQEVVVTGYAERALLLDAQARTGSRLGLTARETPAVIDVLTDAQLQERGARTTLEALNSAAGVTSASLPSSPGILSMRGFTSGSVSLLYDGVRQTTSGLVSRVLDSWSFERIEILKGPASVLYGEGALGGTVNLVPKSPSASAPFFSGLAGYGSFDSLRTGTDLNVPLGARSALRWVASYADSGGYIDDSRFKSLGTTLSWRWEATEAVAINLAADYYSDDSNTSYWGTPLVPIETARQPRGAVRTDDGLVLDRALRDANFNLDDGLTDSKALWLRSRVEVRLSDDWKLANELSYYDAERRWRNSENYTFNRGTGLLDRGLTRIDHDHRFWMERVMLNGESAIGGRRLRLSGGVEYGRNDFGNPRRFGTSASIDPYGDARGSFPTPESPLIFPGAGNRVDFDSTLKNSAAFAEAALNIAPRWLLIAGLRYERIGLDRTVDDFNAATFTAFTRNYEPLSWRAGIVYDLAPRAQVFAQYSSAVAPVGSFVLLSLANSRFALTQGEAVEAGIKASFWGDRADLTASVFDIRQDDIITRDPLNSSIAIQGGSQSSRGVELSLSSALSRSLRLEAGLSALEARFDELIEAGGVDRKGRTPPNVPETVANLFATWRLPGSPVSLSLGARRAGHFFTNNANSVRVRGYTTADASVTWHLKNGELSLRGRNLTDALYGEWTGSSATQVLLGAPRSVEVSYIARFQP